MLRMKENNQGFTLLEMMISVAIFLVIFMVVVGAFMFSEQKLIVLQSEETLYSESRLLVERIARDIRLNTLDYSNTPVWPTSSMTNELRLLDSAGNKIQYRIGGPQCPVTQSDCLLLIRFANGESVGQTDVISTSNIKLIDFNFYVFPVVNPFADFDNDGVYNSDVQPRVTIVFKFVDAEGSGKVFSGQTTVSSRYYAR